MEFIALIAFAAVLAILPALIAIYREKPVAAVAGYFLLASGIPVIGWFISLYLALASDE